MNPATASAIPTVQPVIVNVTTPQASATDYAAWAGFILALLLGIFELWKYWNDKPKLKITYRFEQEIIGRTLAGDFRKLGEGKTFWSVDVANVGSKNMIIIAIAFSRTDTKKMSMLTKDFVGDVNRYTLIPGDNHSYTIPNEMLDSKKVRKVHISDATGKVYKKRVNYKN